MLWQAACEFVAASRKLVRQGFTHDHAWNRLTEYMALFPLVPPTSEVLNRAKPLHTRQGWSFWDAMIVAACLEAGVARLYSEDLSGRVAPEPLQIINPFSPQPGP